MWRTEGRETPEIEFDYREMRIKIDTRGLGRLTGTLRFGDLEGLPTISQTFLLQCGAPNPRGIVKRTGGRFSDFADMLGLIQLIKERVWSERGIKLQTEVQIVGE